MFSFFVFFLLNKYLFKKNLKEKGYNFEKVMGVFLRRLKVHEIWDFY